MTELLQKLSAGLDVSYDDRTEKAEGKKLRGRVEVGRGTGGGQSPGLVAKRSLFLRNRI